MSIRASVVGMERKLAAIFPADVVGYGRLRDEGALVRTMTASHELRLRCFVAD